ncbi:MAG TPA: PAS domain S-box protein [Archangium sp.]|uniref:PAS domain S-box protein n=1 Tax=Archangium sp. TaxID=1872627 RepID=UPI002E2FDAE8|nr:PAS domain S-box protein [Archangium sp.]HEX5751186.1 PAS domain S-box protein [Archangium sp.]
MERLLRLQKVTSKLSQALTPEQVARVIVQQAGPAMGAAECSIYLWEEPGVLRLVQLVGVPQLDLDGWSCVPLEMPVPIADAARTGEPVWMESPQVLLERYPSMEGVPLNPQRAWASLPLDVEGRVLGVLTLGFERERGFAAEDRDFACLVSRQCAQALERAHLYARERELREQAERARAEAEAHRRRMELERNRLQAVLQQLPQAVILAEAPEGRLVMGNAQAVRLHGETVPANWSKEEYTTARTGFHADGRPYSPDEWPLVRALTRGEVVRGEVMEVARPDGSRFSLSVSAGPVRDAEGRVTAAVALMEDITERLRLETSLRQGEAVFRRIMESDMMGLAFSDAEGRIHEANDAFLSLVGHGREVLERGGLRWQALVPPEGREVGERGLRELWARGGGLRLRVGAAAPGWQPRTGADGLGAGGGAGAHPQLRVGFVGPQARGGGGALPRHGQPGAGPVPGGLGRHAPARGVPGECVGGLVVCHRPGDARGGAAARGGGP